MLPAGTALGDMPILGAWQRVCAAILIYLGAICRILRGEEARHRPEFWIEPRQRCGVAFSYRRPF
jgi:hypothetical protein